MEHHELALLSASLAHWRQRAVTWACSHEHRAVAQQHHAYSLAARAYRALVLAAIAGRTAALAKRRATRFNYFRLLKRMRKRWVLYVAHCHKRDAKLSLADELSATLSQRRSLRRLGAFVQRAAVMHRALNRARAHWRATALVGALVRLRLHVALRHHRHRALARARAHACVRLLERAMRWWLRALIALKHKRKRAQLRVREARGSINVGVLGRVFDAWMDAHSRALVAHMKRDRADAAFARTLCAKAMRRMRRVHLGRRLRRAVSACAVAHRTRTVLRARMQRWRDALEKRLRKRGKANVALGVHARRLARTHYDAWLRHYSAKREKRRLLADAIDMRRVLLLRSGGELWLTNALQRQAYRSEVAMRRQAETHARIYARVARYARLWRSRTLARRAERQRRLQLSGFTPYGTSATAGAALPAHRSYMSEFERTFTLPPRALLDMPPRALPSVSALHADADGPRAAAAADRPRVEAIGAVEREPPTLSFGGSSAGRKPPRRPAYLYDDAIEAEQAAALAHATAPIGHAHALTTSPTAERTPAPTHGAAVSTRRVEESTPHAVAALTHDKLRGCTARRPSELSAMDTMPSSPFSHGDSPPPAHALHANSAFCGATAGGAQPQHMTAHTPPADASAASSPGSAVTPPRPALPAAGELRRSSERSGVSASGTADSTSSERQHAEIADLKRQMSELQARAAVPTVTFSSLCAANSCRCWPPRKSPCATLRTASSGGTPRRLRQSLLRFAGSSCAQDTCRLARAPQQRQTIGAYRARAPPGDARPQAGDGSTAGARTYACARATRKRANVRCMHRCDRCVRLTAVHGMVQTRAHGRSRARQHPSRTCRWRSQLGRSSMMCGRLPSALADSVRRRPASPQQRCPAPFQTVRFAPYGPKALVAFLRLLAQRSVQRSANAHEVSQIQAVLTEVHKLHEAYDPPELFRSARL